MHSFSDQPLSCTMPSQLRLSNAHLADEEALDADAGLAGLVVAAVHDLRDDRVQLRRRPGVVEHRVRISVGSEHSANSLQPRRPGHTCADVCIDVGGDTGMAPTILRSVKYAPVVLHDAGRVAAELQHNLLLAGLGLHCPAHLWAGSVCGVQTSGHRMDFAGTAIADGVRTRER